MIKRIVFDLLLFLSVFIFPWWVSFILALGGIFIFRNFYEFIVISIMYYSLFANISTRLISSPIFFAVVIAIIFFVIQVLKDNLSFYKK